MDLTTFLGAACVILAGGGAGLSAAARMRRSVSLAVSARRMTEWMRVQVAVALRPLPMVLSEAGRLFPDLLSAAPDPGELSVRPFLELWEGSVRSSDLPEALEEALLGLGRSLSEGTEPDRAFAVCLNELEEAHASLRERSDGSRRLYVGLGFSAGCMAAILLI